MRTLIIAICGVALAATVLVLRGPSPEAGKASSHREAPLIAEDPSADTTDLYAFRSPDAPSNLTVIANWIPAEDPAAGRTGTASPSGPGTASRSIGTATRSRT